MPSGLAGCVENDGGLVASKPTRPGSLNWGEDTTFGTVRAIDGDTLEVAGVRVDLVGIDAPELGQECRSTGTVRVTTPCGEFARNLLRDAIRIAPVRCRVVGQARGDNRPLAFCAAQVDADRNQIEEMLKASDDPGIQAVVEELHEARDRVRGFRFLDPVLGIISIDLGQLAVLAGLARVVPDQIVHLSPEIRDAADYSAMTRAEKNIADAYGRVHDQ